MAARRCALCDQSIVLFTTTDWFAATTSTIGLGRNPPPSTSRPWLYWSSATACPGIGAVRSERKKVLDAACSVTQKEMVDCPLLTPVAPPARMPTQSSAPRVRCRPPPRPPEGVALPIGMNFSFPRAWFVGRSRKILFSFYDFMTGVKIQNGFLRVGGTAVRKRASGATLNLLRLSISRSLLT